MTDFVTYSISDPRINDDHPELGVFYIGQTSDIKRRCLEHLNGQDERTRERIEELFSLLLVPVIKREEVNTSLYAARLSERHFIEYYSNVVGAQLLNIIHVRPAGEHAGNRGRRLNSLQIKQFVVSRLLLGVWDQSSLSYSQCLYFEKVYIQRTGSKYALAREWLRERNGGHEYP